MNWQQRLDSAITRGSFTDYDFAMLCQFEKCICSELPKELLDTNFVPKDHELLFLGRELCGINLVDTQKAKELYERIHARAAELLRT